MKGINKLKCNHFIFLLKALIFILTSCNDSNPVDGGGGIDPLLLFTAPYDTPVIHPNGKIVGFNHIPMLRIDTINHGLYKQVFDTDSLGFWLINMDGTNMRRVLPYTLDTPDWSPDGKWIVFVKNANIYKMPFDENKMVFGTTQIIQLTFEGRNYFPSWSPDGKWIAYDSNRDSPNGMNFIWKMKSDGSDKTRIAYEPEKGEIREPSWSPDGSKIVHIRYSKDFNTDASEIVVMDENGNNVKRLTFNDYMDYYPKYSPDGSKIAFSSRVKGGLPQLVILDLSKNVIKILTSSGISEIFSWVPDGKKIVYPQHNYNKWSYDNGVLWIIDIDTGNKKQLTFNPKPTYN